MKTKTRKPCCVSTNKIIFWSIAGYAAYITALYIWRKPACEFADRICQNFSETQR